MPPHSHPYVVDVRIGIVDRLPMDVKTIKNTQSLSSSGLLASSLFSSSRPRRTRRTGGALSSSLSREIVSTLFAGISGIGARRGRSIGDAARSVLLPFPCKGKRPLRRGRFAGGRLLSWLSCYALVSSSTVAAESASSSVVATEFASFSAGAAGTAAVASKSCAYSFHVSTSSLVNCFTN